MTLDADQNVTQTAILPIEAERTRGLSLRGADGTAISNGVGLPGEPAAAWILVENLGNAPETVSLQWNSTAWGNDITLHDSTGQEVIPLTAPRKLNQLRALMCRALQRRRQCLHQLTMWPGWSQRVQTD